MAARSALIRAHRGQSMSAQFAERALKRLRRLVGQLPETSEKLSHGAPFFWGGKKTFAAFHDGSYDEGRVGVWIKAPDGVQAELVGLDPNVSIGPSISVPRDG
ncbi:MAG: MmcQ/YjbR family DNA-binding protein [Myxococcota bacterium]